MEMDGWMDGWMDGGMGGRMDEPWSGLDIGLQSTVLTMVEAWVALFGWIHGMELVFVLKRVSSSTLRPSLLPPKNSRRDFHYELGNSSSRYYIA